MPRFVRTKVEDNVSIGSNASILGGITIGKGALIGAGAVVTKDVPENTIVAGNPARILRKLDETKPIFSETEKKVGFVDLNKQHEPIKQEIKEKISEIIDNSAFILGKEVEEFEKEFAAFCGKQFAIGVNSGTSALHLALLACGIKQGDEIITVPNTFIATAESISYTGAKPVFVDINEKNYTINTGLIERAITDKTKAIIPVHLYGHPCDMDPIIEIARKHNLIIIEDCAQAHGAEYKGKKVPVTDIGCFSFYPAKNLGAFGEGGIVATNNPEIAEKIKALRDHGQTSKHTHFFVGYNYRMEGIQGAVLRIKLKNLEKWNELRRKNAGLYNELLRNLNPEILTPYEEYYSKHIYHLYVIRAKERERLIDYLKSKNIDTGIHYPTPIHLQGAYSNLGYKMGDFPIAEKVIKEIVSLPMFPDLTEEQINHVVSTIKEFKSKTL